MWSRFYKKKRPCKFFLNDAKAVGESLLGDYLILRKNRAFLVGKIVEVECYLGIDDDAAHSYRGKKTDRNRVLYEEGGKIYVYLIYGRYWCFNIVVSMKGDPQSVFIRALEPILGLDKMIVNSKKRDIKNLTNGPCRWTKSFGIDGTFWGASICGKDLFISEGEDKNFSIVRRKRIGVDYAIHSKDLPLRFYIKDNSFVSVK